MTKPVKDGKMNGDCPADGASETLEKDFTHSASKQRNFLNKVVQISTVGWTIAAMLIMGVFGGQWLDRKVGTTSFFTVLLSLASVVAVIRYLFELSRKI